MSLFTGGVGGYSLCAVLRTGCRECWVWLEVFGGAKDVGGVVGASLLRLAGCP